MRPDDARVPEDARWEPYRPAQASGDLCAGVRRRSLHRGSDRSVLAWPATLSCGRPPVLVRHHGPGRVDGPEVGCPRWTCRRGGNRESRRSPYPCTMGIVGGTGPTLNRRLILAPTSRAKNLPPPTLALLSPNLGFHATRRDVGGVNSLSMRKRV